MIRIINCRKFISSSSTSSLRLITSVRKGFRDYRENEHFYFPDNRLKTGYDGSPYKAQFNLTDEERVENDKLPVEDRVLDWKKYMKHKGKLKYTTGVYLVDVEPFPRLKIMMLCDMALSYLRRIPDSHEYKHMSFSYIRYIMQVVDENESIIDIESKIGEVTKAEDIIQMLHNEVLLVKTIVRDRIWEALEIEKRKSEADKDFFFTAAGFRDIGYPFFGPNDSAKHKKNEKPERPQTGGFGAKH